MVEDLRLCVVTAPVITLLPVAGATLSTMMADATGEWRNGRRAGFRCQCPSGRGGSSPPSPTVSGSRTARTGGHKPERVCDLRFFVVRVFAR